MAQFAEYISTNAAAMNAVQNFFMPVVSIRTRDAEIARRTVAL